MVRGVLRSHLFGADEVASDNRALVVPVVLRPDGKRLWTAEALVRRQLVLAFLRVVDDAGREEGLVGERVLAGRQRAPRRRMLPDYPGIVLWREIL